MGRKERRLLVGLSTSPLFNFFRWVGKNRVAVSTSPQFPFLGGNKNTVAPRLVDMGEAPGVGGGWALASGSRPRPRRPRRRRRRRPSRPRRAPPPPSTLLPHQLQFLRRRSLSAELVVSSVGCKMAMVWSPRWRCACLAARISSPLVSPALPRPSPRLPLPCLLRPRRLAVITPGDGASSALVGAVECKKAVESTLAVRLPPRASCLPRLAAPPPRLPRVPHLALRLTLSHLVLTRQVLGVANERSCLLAPAMEACSRRARGVLGVLVACSSRARRVLEACFVLYSCQTTSEPGGGAPGEALAKICEHVGFR
jgi:hypothetical protein